MSNTTFFGKPRTAGTVAMKLVLIGFGKHRAWSEHQNKIGESSDKLIRLREKFYWDAILNAQTNKDWEGLPPEARCEIDHWLIWSLPGSVVLGRILASTDQSGRIIPFTVAAEIQGPPLAVAVRLVAARLEQFTYRSHQMTERSSVEAAFASEQGVLESFIAGKAVVAGSASPTAQERASFAAQPGLDAGGVALARVVYKIESSWKDFARSRGDKPPRSKTGVVLRLPSISGQPICSVLMWEEFVTAHVHRDVPRLYLVPAAHDWLDVAVGEIEGSHFFGLQAGPKRIPLETQVAHEVSPELVAQAKQMLETWRSGPLAGASRAGGDGGATQAPTGFVPRPQTQTPAASASDANPITVPIAAAQSGSGADPPDAAGSKKRGWLPWVIGVVVLGIGAGLVVKTLSESGKTPASDTSVSGAPQSAAIRQPTPAPEPSVPPEVVQVKQVPALQEGGAEQAMDLTVIAQTGKISMAKLKLEVAVEPAGPVSARTVFTNNGWQLLLQPQAAGTAAIKLTATDERGLASKPASFPVTVAPLPVGPELVLMEPLPSLEMGGREQAVNIGVKLQQASLSLGKLSWSVNSVPPDRVRVQPTNSAGNWQLRLTPLSAGSVRVSVSATDERGQAGKPLVLELEVQPPPTGPEIAAVKQPPSLEEGGTEQVLDLAVKLQNEGLSLTQVSWKIGSDPSGLLATRTNLTGTNWQLVLAPVKAGKAQVTVTATDQRGISGKPASFPIVVAPKYAAPVFEPVAAVTLTEDQPATNLLVGFRLDPRASPDKTQVEAQVDKPQVTKAETRLTEGKAQLLLTPKAAGNATVRLSVTDEGGLRGETSFAVTVLSRPSPPSVTPASSATPAAASIGQLNEELEILAVRFSVISPKDATFEKARYTPVLNSRITLVDKRTYMAKVTQLERAFKAAGATPAISLDKLRDNITRLTL
jgi:hypothetical protein